MSQQPQSSSNETNFSFAAAPAAINDTPGSVESGGGGGTMSYVAPGSGTSTSDFTMVSNATSHRGSARRSTSSAALEDASGLGPADVRPADRRPHPSANPQAARQGMREKPDYDVNFNIGMRSWIEVNKQGLNLRAG